MDRIQTFVALDDLESAFVNTIQDRIPNAKKAQGDLELTGFLRSTPATIAQFGAVANRVASATSVQVDDIDWRKHFVEGFIVEITSDLERIGGASEAFINGQFESSKRFTGYLGTGANPVTFSRAGGDYFINDDAGALKFRIYATQSNGKLNVYNATGAAKGFFIFIRSLGSMP